MEEHAPPRWLNINVPPGYHFKPTARELIQCYLEPWVATEPGQQSPGEFYGIMAVADVCAEDPATLASRFQHMAHDDGSWYFLSVSRWKDSTGNRAGSSNRMNRAVGGDLGTWHGSGRRLPVRGGVGFRQTFEFRIPDKTDWLMEEFSTVWNEASSQEGVKVLCRLHLTPSAAAAAAAGNGRQQLQATNNGPAPAAAGNNKRKRQRAAPARQVRRHIDDADGWTTAPAPPPDVVCSSSYATAAAPAPLPADVVCSSSYATAAAPAPLPADVVCSSSYATTAAAPAHPDVGCSSYATTSSQAQAAAAPVTELTAEALAAWQHQPMMEKAQAGDGGYQYHHCAGVHGGVYIRADDEPPPLEMVAAADVEFTAQDFKLEDDSDFMFTAEHLLQLDDNGWTMESNSNAFSFLQLMSDGDGVQENNDPKPEPGDGGVQENNDDDPKGGTGAS